MIDRAKLLSDLQALLRKLEPDLLERSSSVSDVEEVLRSDYAQAKQAERTAQSFEEWRSDAITQVASAWVLSGVFVRFLEDNQLIDPPIAAGVGERLQRARDEHELYFRQHPQETDREYWLMGFDRLAKLPGTREIFGTNNRIRELPNWLSGDAAGDLLRFFQRVEPSTGELVHDFSDENWDTRFLGDLYQDLSEAARKKYALLQTPEFVESFILDRTLDPAIAEFSLTPSPSPQGEGDKILLPPLPGERGAGGMRVFRMIDPACGSGHFLLGSFRRLLDRWLKKEPGTNMRELVQRSLDSVHGVDINPYAVAIARFRLLLVAMKESGIRRLRDAPAFRIQVVCGDSLLHGEGTQLAIEGVSPKDHHYKSEDIAELNRILIRGHYHAVVANPPYITPKDSAANEAYRKLYKETCYRQYSLAVPFMQRIYSLAVAGGFTGQITANSFMKREFGKKLIENFIPNVDLTHVIDTSGAYIPGHGTPTVILFGRNRKPIVSTIRAVMGIKGEPSTPENPANGLVWSAILNQVDHAGSQSEFVSVTDSARVSFCKHPWSIGGGGASDLKEWLEKNSDQPLLNLIEPPIGRAVRIGEEEVFIFNSTRKNNSLCSTSEFRGYLIGENLRDWALEVDTWVWYPYSGLGKNSDMVQQLWSWRTALANRSTFQGLMADAGLAWFDYMQHTASAYKTPLSIAFAEVATHNHFVLDRGGKVFKQTAPVIKLSADATEDDHLVLLGLLNSSIACFWLKQVCFPKKGFSDAKWEERMAFNSSNIENFPLPLETPLLRSWELDQLSLKLTALSPAQNLNSDQEIWLHTLHQMIALQEELDWQCYQLYGLIDEDLTYAAKISPHPPTPSPQGEGEPDLAPPSPWGEGGWEGEGLPPIALGQRAFEIVMARKMAAGELQTAWFDRHHSIPITDFPIEWSDDYKQLIQRRINVIERDRNIALIEQPEYKRRWNTEPWDSQLERALRNWLLDRLESYFDFDGRMRPHPPTPSPQGEGEPETLSPPLPRERGQGGEGISKLAGQLRQIPEPLLQRARELRQNQTPVEEILWECLRDRRFLGAKFRRQHNLGQYIADFYCHTARLVVELDGEIHQTQQTRDSDRDQWMRENSFTVLRFPNNDVLEKIDQVLSAIAQVLNPHPPTPSLWGEGEPETPLPLSPPLPRERGQGGEGNPPAKIDISLISIAQLADLARQDPKFLQIGELYRNDPTFNVQKLVTELVEAESVPLLPILRYKPTGLRKRTEWEHTWHLQRREDEIDDRTKLDKDHPDYLPKLSTKALKQQEIGDIPVPPKYTNTDFQKSHYWKLRGKLDVPKERWVSFPHCNAEDGTLTIAWAGYNHLQLAQAISAYFVEVQERLGGREDPRLPPLLANLLQLLPWLKQWHNDLDPIYNLAMGDYFEAFIQDEARQIDQTLDDIRSWQPPTKTNRRR